MKTHGVSGFIITPKKFTTYYVGSLLKLEKISYGAHNGMQCDMLVIDVFPVNVVLFLLRHDVTVGVSQS